jgi:hypothetical protein
MMSKQVYDGYTYKECVYSYEKDYEDDNIKIFHEVECTFFIWDTESGPMKHWKERKKMSMDWSPYSFPTQEDFNLWIDLGMPKRIGIGPLNSKDLKTIQEKNL